MESPRGSNIVQRLQAIVEQVPRRVLHVDEHLAKTRGGSNGDSRLEEPATANDARREQRSELRRCTSCPSLADPPNAQADNKKICR